MSQITTETTGSIDSIGGFNLNKGVLEDAYYFIDYSKLNSVNDLMLVLSAVGFNFHTSHPHFDSVKQFLDLNNPVRPPKPESK